MGGKGNLVSLSPKFSKERIFSGLKCESAGKYTDTANNKYKDILFVCFVEARPVSVQSSQDRSSSTPTEGYQSRVVSILVGVLFLATLPVIVGVVIACGPSSSTTTRGVLHPSAMGDAAPQLPAGEQVYVDSCMLCHGAEGVGTVGLGKPLVNTAYMRENSDDALFAVIANGRLPDDPANTSGAVMPARGAKQLSDEQIHDVIGYIRGLADPSQPVVSIDAWVIERVAAPTSSAAVSSVGRDLYVSSCSSCHGANGEGMEGLGKAFVGSDFVASKTDKELMTMIKMGRPIWDAENTTGIDMPPKGGNPALSDDELADIITFLRAISTTAED